MSPITNITTQQPVMSPPDSLPDTTNLVLTLTSDGQSYQRRLDLTETFIRTRNRDAAVKGMAALLRAMIAKQPQLFEAWERTPDMINAAAGEALDSLVEDIETVSPVLTAPAPREHEPELIIPAAHIPVRLVDTDVQTVLQRCRVEDGRVFLPDTQLERKLYERTRAVLAAMGGKWTAGKTQAFVFAQVEPAAFAACFEELKATGRYTDPKDLGFFETQSTEADLAIKLAGLRPGMRVMEPSAGRAALARRAADIVGIENVHCVELFAPNARVLEKAGFSVREQDFLSVSPPVREEDRYDVIIMNPPFGNMQDAAHVTHACDFLKTSGRLVAITSTSWEYRTSHQKADRFRELLVASQAEISNITAGAFKAAGTMVPTRIITINAENLPWNRQALEDALSDPADLQALEELTEAPAP